MKTERTCFVIMPFSAELHFFYLYLQKHVEEKHRIICKRGDADILTVPLLEKIRQYIADADVIIADCSGRNPNVFYELGMAHTLNKKVILITKDAVEEAPVDVRHYEFIRYDLLRHREFLDSLDRALRTVFVDRYEDLYERGTQIFEEFRQRTGSRARIANKEVFTERVIAAEQVGSLPSLDDDLTLREFLLPRMILDTNEIGVIKDIASWYQIEIGGN